MIIRLCHTFLLVIVFWIVGESQNSTELQKEQNRLHKKIELTNNYLKNTRSDKAKALNEYNVVRQQVMNREKLLKNINTQLEQTKNSQEENELKLLSINAKFESLKDNWKQLIRASWKQKLSSNFLVELLSSQSLKVSFRKLQYYKQLARYTEQKAILLQSQTDSIQYLLDEIERQKVTQENLLAEGNKQNKILSTELNLQSSTLKALEKSEKKLMAQLKEQNLKKDRLSTLIQKTISKELARSSKSNSKVVELSGSFEDNKGRLPWPVKNGIISKGFGTRTHPVNHNVKIDNDGIDIRTIPGSQVKSIFPGIVTSINQIPGFGNVVIVNAGAYFLVYGRLSSITVSAGQQVIRGESLGTLGITNDISELQLQIWKGQTKLNPEQWLIKK